MFLQPLFFQSRKCSVCCWILRQFQSLLYNYVWISNGENKTFIKNRWRFQFNSILHAANHNYKWNGFKESNVLMVFWYFSWSPPLSLYRPFPSVFSSCNASPSPSFDRSSLKDQKCLHRYKIVEHKKIPSSGIEEKHVDMFMADFLQFNQ